MNTNITSFFGDSGEKGPDSVLFPSLKFSCRDFLQTKVPLVVMVILNDLAPRKDHSYDRAGLNDMGNLQSRDPDGKRIKADCHLLGLHRRDRGLHN